MAPVGYPGSGNKMRKQLANVLFLFGLPVLLVVVWWSLTLGGGSFYIPTPGKLVDAVVSVWGGERFFTDLVPSLARLAVGLVITIGAGIGLGFLIGISPLLRKALEPLMDFFRAIPPPVLIPVLSLLIGINDQMRIAAIVVGAIWPVLLNTVEGVRSTDEVLSEVCQVFHLTPWQRVVYFIAPAASPQIMTGVRQSLSTALILLVIAEMFGASEGIGFTVILFQRSFKIPEMWSGILVLGLIGIALATVTKIVEGRVLNWYYGLKDVQHAG